MSEFRPKSIERPDWQRREGFTMVTDVAFKVLDDIAPLQPAAATMDSIGDSRVYEAALADITDTARSLYVAATQLSGGVPGHEDITHDPRYGLDKQDIRQGYRYAYQSGVGELAFTWHFAPALAQAAVRDMVDTGHLDQQDVDTWSLSDWANIVGTGWFSRTAHTMAYTRNGIYRRFGSSPHSYEEGALQRALQGSGIPIETNETLFDIQERYEPEDEQVYVTAFPNKKVRAALRAELELSDRPTGGCPVARFSTMLPHDMLAADPHAANLIHDNIAEVVPERATEDEAMLRLPWSPIDATLAVLASKLEQYEELHGTPKIVQKHNPMGHMYYDIEHERGGQEFGA